METYSLLRQFADSWMLLLLTLVFVGVVIWAFRPGSRKLHDDSANLIFRNEDKPAPRDDPQDDDAETKDGGTRERENHG